MPAGAHLLAGAAIQPAAQLVGKCLHQLQLCRGRLGRQAEGQHAAGCQGLRQLLLRGRVVVRHGGDAAAAAARLRRRWRLHQRDDRHAQAIGGRHGGADGAGAGEQLLQQVQGARRQRLAAHGGGAH